jgi:uncharacterized protein YcbX
MAFIASLNLYPVKSCAGIALGSARLTTAGLEFDREWMVVTPDGEFVTQRQRPRMALVATRLTEDTLELSAPGMPSLTVPIALNFARERRPVRVWRDRVASFDEGGEAAAWLSEFLGTPLRLVRFAPDATRLSNPEYTLGRAAFAKFADAYALLIIASASLADLNARLARKSLAPLPMNRFRPNLVLDGDDLGPYDEDRITLLRAEGIALMPVKACVRCSITTTDQRSAEVHSEPLITLAAYRTDAKLGGPTFGQNAIVIEGQGREIRVGDSLDVEWNF